MAKKKKEGEVRREAGSQSSEGTGERSGLPEHRKMGVRRDLGEGDIDNPGGDQGRQPTHEESGRGS